jgi:hypothetical protein
VKPVLQALILAEHVYQDISGKKVIAGTFNRVRFSRNSLERTAARPDGSQETVVPEGQHAGAPTVYVSLTDLCDNTPLQIQFVNLTKNEVLLTKTITVNCLDRLATIELALPLPPLVPFIDEAGTYALEVVWEGEILGSCRVKAEEMATSD